MPNPILKVDNLSRSFGGVRAVDDVSFTVEEGEIASIIGPNGAGKTTLFNLITGFLEPDRGSIKFNDRELTGNPPEKITAFGLVRTFQLVRLFAELTTLENVMVGFHLRSRGGLVSAVLPSRAIRDQEHEVARDAAILLDLVGLGERAWTLASHLTYGQQRLLEIARALATRPKLLLLDEPAAGLNPAETARLADLVRVIRDRGTGILFVEHDMSLVMQVAEKVIVLDFGRKISEGAPDAVRNDPAVLAAYLGTT